MSSNGSASETVVLGDPQLDSLIAQDRLFGVCVAFLGFSATFIISWILFGKYSKKFNVIASAMKADSCSRVNSTIHSIIVVPALSYGILKMSWGEHMEPLGSVSYLQSVLCITIGYFACDTVITLMYQIPLWGVFVAHHLIASFPYVVYMFIAKCHYGLFILSCFMLVEFSNISLNAQAFLEQHGMGGSQWYAIAFYATFIGWIFCRIINPVSMLIVLHMKILPGLPDGQRLCMIPSAICAYLICFFCIGVFVFVLCKEVLLRWKASPNPKEVAPLNEDVRPIDLNTTTIEMTDEEREITLESPTRILLHEAREKMQEIERTITIEIERHRSNSLVENRSNRSAAKGDVRFE